MKKKRFTENLCWIYIHHYRKKVTCNDETINMDLTYDGFTLTKLAILGCFYPPFLIILSTLCFYLKNNMTTAHTIFKIHLFFLKWQKIYDLACSWFMKEFQVSFNWWPSQYSTEHSHFLFSNILVSVFEALNIM